jgi:hypothetical protein
VPVVSLGRSPGENCHARPLGEQLAIVRLGKHVRSGTGHRGPCRLVVESESEGDRPDGTDSRLIPPVVTQTPPVVSSCQSVVRSKSWGLAPSRTSTVRTDSSLYRDGRDSAKTGLIGLSGVS